MIFDLNAPSLGTLKEIDLWATYYYMYVATEISPSLKGVDLLGKNNEKIGIRLTEKDYYLAAIEGTVVIKKRDGTSTTLNYWDHKAPELLCDCRKYADVSKKTGMVRFHPAKGKFGDGVSGFRLVPYRTIAVDKNVIPLGTVIYIPSARGQKVILPDGTESVHDGYFFAGDVGGKIKGSHIDVFQGSLRNRPFAQFISSSASKGFAAYVVEDSEIIKTLTAEHTGAIPKVLAEYISSNDEVEVIAAPPATLSVLKRGHQGAIVRSWQLFLIGQRIDPKGVDGVFGKDTESATIRFQKRHRLETDGIVGSQTWGKAVMLGFPVVRDARPASDKYSDSWPPKPRDLRTFTHAERVARFGSFDFEHDPKPKNFENIRITSDWKKKNLVKVNIPEVAGLTGGYSGNVYLHKDVKDNIIDLWSSWKKAGLIDRVISWEGMYNARFKRGTSKARMQALDSSALSNHSWGTAFDINYRWNKLYAVPALLGEKGCVRELVEIANQHGCFWGGHWTSPRDGMHFEVAQRI